MQMSVYELGISKYIKGMTLKKQKPKRYPSQMRSLSVIKTSETKKH